MTKEEVINAINGYDKIEGKATHIFNILGLVPRNCFIADLVFDVDGNWVYGKVSHKHCDYDEGIYLPLEYMWLPDDEVVEKYQKKLEEERVKKLAEEEEKERKEKEAKEKREKAIYEALKKKYEGNL